MKRYIQLSLVPVLLGSPLPLLAGDLNSPATPDDSDSAMYTIEDIYNRLEDGTEGTKRSAFTEPNSGPTTGTGKTLDDVMAKAPTVDNDNGAAPGQVVSGKTYWSLRNDGTWGLQEGTGTDTGELTCSGILHGGGTRWCDNQDGTVTDMTTGLVWLQKADWGGRKLWSDNINEEPDDAHVRAGLLEAGATDANLSDGSTRGDWRLPTQNELLKITNGSEAVRSSNMRAFSNVQLVYVWSSTTSIHYSSLAESINLGDGKTEVGNKSTHELLVWPVRGGK